MAYEHVKIHLGLFKRKHKALHERTAAQLACFEGALACRDLGVGTLLTC